MIYHIPKAAERQGYGSGTRRLRRKTPLLFAEKNFKTVCFDSDRLLSRPAQTSICCVRSDIPSRRYRCLGSALVVFRNVIKANFGKVNRKVLC